MSISSHVMEPDPELQDLYPELSPDELGEAAEALARYVAVILRQYERIRNDPEAYDEFRRLTNAEKRARMKEEKSKVGNNS